KHYDAVRAVGEHVVLRTNTSEAPWVLVEATDERYRNLAVGRALLAALRGRLDHGRAEPPPPPPPTAPEPAQRNLFNQLDLSLAADPAAAKKQLKKAQGELGALTRRLRKEGRSMILAFEGPDAAGKGGAIRRLTAAMDAR